MGDRPEPAVDVEQLFAPIRVRAFVSTADPATIEELHPEEREAIGSMVPSRQAEFATARACARAAMAELGVHGPVVRTASGAPRWPSGVHGSISHTRGLCVGAASTEGPSIGIDIEEIHRMKRALERRVLVEAERQELGPLTDDERQHRVATVFAAKEAFYKAHYAVDARYLGFDAVRVVVGRDGSLRFGIGSGAVGSAMLAHTWGRWLVNDGRVVAGVAIDRSVADPALPSPR